MSEAQNEKSKKKRKPAYFPGWLIKLLLVIVCLIVLSPFVASGFVVLLFVAIPHTHDFPQREIAEACTSLALPLDSAFCTEPVQNSATLETLLEQMYPPNVTTVGDLEHHFMARFTCDSPTICRLEVPISFVTVKIYREEGSGQITEYEVRYDD